MTKGEIAIADILLAVAQRKTTVTQLKRKLADGLAVIKQMGAKNVERSLIEEMALIESAIARIEAEKIKYSRTKNN